MYDRRKRVLNFNTKKVRLKLVRGTIRPATNRNFNTKKVRLKLRTAGLTMLLKSYFNTKKVRLKQDFQRRCFHGIPRYFNTKKVRLKLSPASIRRATVSAFQYQKGAIKTLAVLPRLLNEPPISIPKRCD